MKCVRLKDGGLIVRVPNDEAREIVRENRGRYTPKKDWKAQERTEKKAA